MVGWVDEKLASWIFHYRRSLGSEVVKLCVEIKAASRLLSYISNTHLTDMTASLRSKFHSFCEMPTKKPRRGPNCGANTPMPEPSLIS